MRYVFDEGQQPPVVWQQIKTAKDLHEAGLTRFPAASRVGFVVHDSACDHEWLPEASRRMATTGVQYVRFAGVFGQINLGEWPSLLGLSLTWPSTLSLVTSSEMRLKSLSLHMAKRTLSAAGLLLKHSRNSLRELRLSDTSDTDLDDLAASTSDLRFLGLKDCAKLGDASAIAKLTSLQSLQLMLAPKLAHYELPGSVESVEVTTCKKASLENVVGTNISKLHWNNNGLVASLLPVNSIEHLRNLMFIQSTEVQDGRIRWLSEKGSLRTVAFQDRGYYDSSCIELRARLEDRHGPVDQAENYTSFLHWPLI